jgi:hypothetical protein
MRTSETTKNIMTALIEVLPEIKNLYPEAKGYGYDYIPLQAVIDEIKGKLANYRLGVIQLPVSNDASSIGVCTRIIHDSGEWIEETFYSAPTTMKGTNNTQQIGAAITYLRRYALISLCGITGDTDTDGLTAAETKQPKQAEIKLPTAKEVAKDDLITLAMKKEVPHNILEYLDKLPATIPEAVFNRDKANLLKYPNSPVAQVFDKEEEIPF